MFFHSFATLNGVNKGVFHSTQGIHSVSVSLKWLQRPPAECGALSKKAQDIRRAALWKPKRHVDLLPGGHGCRPQVRESEPWALEDLGLSLSACHAGLVAQLRAVAVEVAGRGRHVELPPVERQDSRSYGARSQ